MVHENAACQQKVKTMFRKSAAVLLSSLFLGACAWAPGVHIDADATKNSWLDFDDQNPIEVTVQPITFDMVNEGSASPVASVDKELISNQPHIYRLGGGDVLLITVYEHTELTMPAGPNTHPSTSGTVIKADGHIFVPYVGRVEAVGKTTDELRQEITAKLAKYINKPQLEVRVVQFNSQLVTVAGEVANPTIVPVTEVPLTLQQAIQSAGGLTKMASERQIALSRAGKRYDINLTELYQTGFDVNSIKLQAGDSIYIPDNSSEKVFVMGELTKAQAVQFKRAGLSLTEAISEAGGLDNRYASAKGIFVIRNNADNQGVTLYQLNAESDYAFAMGDKFELQPRDVVYVTASDVTRWNRVITQLLPTASLLNVGSNIRDDVVNN